MKKFKFPSKTEIIGVRFRKDGLRYDFNELMSSLRGIYLYHKPVMMLNSENWTEGIGKGRGDFIYHYYLCRRRALPVVLWNICRTYVISHIFASDEADKGNHSGVAEQSPLP